MALYTLQTTGEGGWGERGGRTGAGHQGALLFYLGRETDEQN